MAGLPPLLPTNSCLAAPGLPRLLPPLPTVVTAARRHLGELRVLLGLALALPCLRPAGWLLAPVWVATAAAVSHDRATPQQAKPCVETHTHTHSHL
jgi:hypothetical protein